MLSERELFRTLFAGASKVWTIYCMVAAGVADRGIVALPPLSKAADFDAVGNHSFPRLSQEEHHCLATTSTPDARFSFIALTIA